MKGFLADSCLELNRIEARRQELLRNGREILDLSVSNPTDSGFCFPSDLLIQGATSYFRSRKYHPNPKGLPIAREALATYLLNRFPRTSISSERILLVASTSEAYRLLLSVLCEPGDQILLPVPCYPIIDLICLDTRIHTMSYELDPANSWEPCKEYDSDDYELLCIITPHNPTGAIHRKPAQWISQSRKPIISDAVFMEYCWDTDSPSVLELYPDQPVFELGGISKSFALPDLKLGWIVMNEAAYELAGERLEFLADQYLSANQLSQSLLPMLLTEGYGFVESMRSTLRDRTLKAHRLLISNPNFRAEIPAGGPFVYATAKTEEDDESFALRALEAGIYIHPGHFYGAEFGCSFALSTMVEPNILRSGIERIHSLLP